MKPIRIFRHVDCEGPGYLTDFLHRRGIPQELVAIDQGAAVPTDLDDVSGLVFMGGGMSVNDELPWIGAELDLIRRAADRQVPVLGHCLGGQLIAKALGAPVIANPVTEIGWFDVECVDNETADAWFEGLPRRFEVFHWHGETFDLPNGATHVLRNEYCHHQAFAIGNILAMQCHVEMTNELVMEWVQRFHEQLEQPADTINTFAQITHDVPERCDHLHRIADVIYTNWLEGLS